MDDEGIGAQVHGLSLKQGLCYKVVVETGLIDMYSKCCNVEGSKRVFDKMKEKNVITWTSMVTVNAQNEQPDDEMILFKEMLRFGLRPNCVAYNSLLSSFSSLEYLGCCKQVHCRAVHEGLLDNVYIVVTLATIYSVELADEAEPHATHVGVPAGIKSAVNPVASLGVRVKGAREKLENSRWQNCYEEIPIQLDVAGIS